MITSIECYKYILLWSLMNSSSFLSSDSLSVRSVLSPSGIFPISSASASIMDSVPVGLCSLLSSSLLVSWIFQLCLFSITKQSHSQVITYLAVLTHFRGGGTIDSNGFFLLNQLSPMDKTEPEAFFEWKTEPICWFQLLKFFMSLISNVLKNIDASSI